VPDTLTRRSLLVTGGFATLAMTSDALARLGGDVPRGAPDLRLPENNLQALARMAASLKEEDVPWWYDGTIYAVLPGQNPRALFRFEGMELYWLRHLPAGEYELIGNTVTFLRDLETGEWLTEFRNPFTGAVNEVKPAIQGGGPGRGFNYSVKGIRFTPALDRMPEKPLLLSWTFARDLVWLHNETVYPPGLPPPRAQRQTMFATRRDFTDPALDSVPALFSSTVHMPWLRWMDMEGHPGHLVWHASGVKLKSVAELPAEYRARAEKEYPQMLTADPARESAPL
jgi:hypothetical protein